MQIAGINGSISSLTQTSGTLVSRIESAEGAISEIKQTPYGLTLSVDDIENPTKLQLLSDSAVISSLNIGLLGTVTFADLEDANSYTVINGANITTGTISAIGISACDIVGGTIVGGDIHGSNITLYHGSNMYEDTAVYFQHGSVYVGSLYMYTASTAGTAVGIMLETYNYAALKLYSSGNLSIQADGVIYLMAPDGTAWHFNSDGIYHGTTKVVSG